MTAPVKRASPTDLAFRAMGSGAARQEQPGAVLLLGRDAGHLRHQRRFPTLVGDVRGPDRPVALAGAPVP